MDEQDKKTDGAAEVARYKKRERSAEEKKLLSNRINRIIGQMHGIAGMVQDDRYCGDVLIQVAAVNKAIKALANAILDAHLHTCVADEIRGGNMAAADEVVELFRLFQ